MRPNGTKWAQIGLNESKKEVLDQRPGNKMSNSIYLFGLLHFMGPKRDPKIDPLWTTGRTIYPSL